MARHARRTRFATPTVLLVLFAAVAWFAATRRSDLPVRTGSTVERSTAASREQAPPPTAYASVASRSESGTIVGRVTVRGSGDPLAGATVQLMPRGQPDATPTATASTAATGEFQLEGIPLGDFDVIAAARGFSPPYRAPIAVVRPGAATPVRIAMGSAIPVAGRVVDTSGQPVAGATVVIGRYPGSERHTDTNLGGRFEIDLVEDHSTLWVWHPGHRVEWKTWIELLDARGQLLEITLSDESALAGRAVDARGEPLVGLQIDATADSHEDSSGAFASRPAHFGEFTDADGSFRFRSLYAGRYVLTYTDPARHETRTFGPFVLADGERRSDLVLQANGVAPRRDRFITGRVVDSRGAGVAGARVWVFNLKEPSTDALCDRDGRFRVGPLVAGAYEVSVGALHVLDTNVVGVEAGDDVTLTLARAGTLTGRLVDADTNEPIALLESAKGTSSTSPNGSFVIDLPSDADERAVEIGAPGYLRATLGPFRKVVEVSLDVGVVRLRMAGGVEGRLVDERGQPVMDATLFIDRIDQNQRLRGVTTNPDLGGGFDFGALEPGEWCVRLSDLGYAPDCRSGVPVSLGPGEAVHRLLIRRESDRLVRDR